MQQENGLGRFLNAQQHVYSTALAEISSGRKRSHWMWFIFPQVAGLGYSETSRYYAIKSRQEAEAYLRDPVLGTRLTTISQALLELPETNPGRIFGSPDDLKLHSSMTLFASLPGAPPVFEQVLDKFFRGRKDDQTLRILERI